MRRKRRRKDEAFTAQSPSAWRQGQGESQGEDEGEGRRSRRSFGFCAGAVQDDDVTEVAVKDGL